MSKQGSTLAGMMDAFSIAVSVGLQYGVPLETYVSKFTNMRFEPAGMTDDPDVRMAQSIVDYIFRRLALDFLPLETRSALGIHSAEERQRHLETGSYKPADDEVDVEGLAQSAPRAPGAEGGIATPKAGVEVAKPAPKQAHTSAKLVEMQLGIQADAPLCFSCGTKMQRAGSCYICEGCGSTSGCSERVRALPGCEFATEGGGADVRCHRPQHQAGGASELPGDASAFRPAGRSARARGWGNRDHHRRDAHDLPRAGHGERTRAMPFRIRLAPRA
ncbi:hypothetical protein SGRIM128S_02392 [Streptomyces griseomycini]